MNWHIEKFPWHIGDWLCIDHSTGSAHDEITGLRDGELQVDPTYMRIGDTYEVWSSRRVER